MEQLRQQGFTHFRTLAEAAGDVVLCTDDAGIVLFASARATQMFGYALSALEGMKVAELIVADGLGDGTGAADRPRRLSATGRRADGQTFPIDLTVVSVRIGAASALVWVLDRAADTTPLIDPLTGLPARAFCVERVRQRLERTGATLDRFALLLVSVAGLAAIESDSGRDMANVALKEISVRLRDGLVGADLIGRFDEDEFCVIVPDAGNASEIDALAQMLANSLAFPIEHAQHTCVLEPKVGVALAPADGATVAELIAHASAALDRARTQTSPVHFYSDEASRALAQRRTLQEELRAALDRNEFTLDFLPVINLETGAVAGAEALLRWQHPQRGDVAPLDFIPLAEESGLMNPIGSWVIREALRCQRRWEQAGFQLRVSVNVTSRQLEAPGFVRQLAASIAAAGCKPEALELELTEAVAMQHAATVQLLLAEIRRMGVKIALDDFGTGYSSMAYLKSLPVDIIKIDRSFVDGVPVDNDDSSIVRALVAFALCTGRDVRAEGVTSLEQARWLHAEGCDAAQGYFFARPIPAVRFDDWLKAYAAEGVTS
jgi:diguanylate cyclase (GGDEF)-like protein/PAS domain S-box-containing protein